MCEKIKVLFYTELWANAGIESVIMSLFRNFDLSNISVDIMASQNLSNFYDEEIEKLGGKKIITLDGEYDSPAKRMIANRSAFEKAIRENHYDVVHIHMCNAAAMQYGKIAKKNGVKIVAYHSHNTNLSTNYRAIKTIIHNISKIYYEKYADAFFSCSDLASKWMFTKRTIKKGKVTIINNAIDLQKFEFNEEERKKYRKKLNVGNKFLMGHIGRFAVAKNHPFLIDIFYELHKINPDSMLLLIGEGEDEQIIKRKVAELGINEDVIFYGVTKEIPQMLWAMDAFVLPSLFEGNPVVGIEAQAASLPCFFSDTITKMCKLTDMANYLSLEEDPKFWAKAILKNNVQRNSTRSIMEKSGYDIRTIARDVQNKYFELLKKGRKE